MKEQYMSCLNSKDEANPLKNEQMARVFMLQDLGSSHIECFDSSLFTCVNPIMLCSPGERAFKTLVFHFSK